MDFKDSIFQLAKRVSALKESIQTEEATKNAFIMPFIQMLGYDVFNPLEVVPEMDCDIAKKKGEKIDYAIMKDGSPIMLIECKHWKQDLNLHDNQLKRYYVASKAKFGVLTNGIVYRFYADLIKENIMDDVPFLEFDLEKIRETQIEEVKKFCKANFDLDNILSSANDLKYMSEVKKIIRSEFSEPSPELVKMLTKRVYEGIVTQKVLDQFTDIVKRALKSHINDVMSEKLGIAIKATEAAGAPVQTASTTNEQKEEPLDDEKASKILTTVEELEGYYIVKSIVCEVISSERVTYRDSQSYFAIFADDNNRRPICRLHFNNTNNKRIGLVDENRNEQLQSIDKLDDIYKYKKQLIDAAKRYV
ncbi:MAG: type I restriction enzyme HsdR N-terminal domain-containing protein [Bacteroidaceae bacterium]|nr:type I restriction enzyme HsdR N-terminal domain-containing protein [Bacteroidaceae bacterium]